MSIRHNARTAIGALLAVAALATGACSSATGPAAVDKGEGTFSVDEVRKATNDRVTSPLFAVPKKRDGYTFAFLNPGLSIPTFVEWKNGMKAAAEFYGGVTLVETDLALDYPKSASAFETIAVRNPTIVGTGAGAGTPGLLEAVRKNNMKPLLIDQEPAADKFDWFGVNNVDVGRIGAEALVKKAKERVAGDWAGADVVYLGASVANCPPCDARVRKGGEVVKQELGLKDDKLQYLSPADGSAAAEEAAITDFLTAHPNSKVVALGYGDGGAVGALNALNKAGRLKDGLVVSLGGDPSGRAALRDRAMRDTFVGAVDFNPYAQGWNWVEAAIALQQGKPFEAYQVERFLTYDNVNMLYPND
ncbi:sugar ABC transporter substrate-binding protein [Lentzea sp. JNUCC 0626]|uniref:sugar ABC transporter substrate-binding protein n=1 Tax=Lentzea sp. JNUCC 0626 TaxID=3367513 RepID=UPI0037478B38